MSVTPGSLPRPPVTPARIQPPAGARQPGGGALCGPVGVAALLAALYPCPTSPTGHHRIPRGEYGCLDCDHGHATGPRRPVYAVSRGRKL